MKNIPILLISAAFLLSCNPGEMYTDGHTIFKIDEGNSIEYATSGYDSKRKPEIYTITTVRDIPDENSIEILNLIPLNERDILIITRKHGLYRIKNLGKSWQRIDSGLPPEVVYPFKNNKLTKPIVSHSVSKDKKRIAVVVPSALYISVDGGNNFSHLPLKGIRRYTELLSVALHPENARLVVLGTSTSGIYYSKDMGKTVRRIRRGVPGEPVRTPNFLEEIRSLCFGNDEDTFYAGFGSGNGVYRGSISKRILKKIDAPLLVTYPDGDFYRITSINYLNGNLLIGTDRKWRRIIPLGKSRPINKFIKENFLKSKELISIDSGGYNIAVPKQYQPKRKFIPDRRALGKKGLYISYSFTQRHNYAKLTRLLRYLKLNAVVINLKDDYGKIRVPAANPIITQIPGSVAPYVNVVKTIERLHRDGIYVIARQVVFKDEMVYDYQNYKYAIKNRGGYPFRKGPEKWVDAHSEFVWDYNIAAAKAFVKAGVDEIQFDYIRFPDVRGKGESRRFDFKRKHQSMREALASFLKKAREEIDIPISMDLFGYNAIYKWGSWIGQDITELSQYVDVISPMFYPSHYTGGFGHSYGKKRIYYIIYLSCKRARELTGGVHIRPFIQAFYYKDNWDKYCPDYIGWELDGIKNAGLEDYIFWNDLVGYKILIRGMRKYLSLGEGQIPPEIKKSIPKKLPFKTIVER